MFSTSLQWGTVPEWFTALAFFLALYSIVREHNKDRYSAHLARLGRARRVSINYELEGPMKLIEGQPCYTEPQLAYYITNNSEFPIFSVYICPWEGDMPVGVAAKTEEIIFRLDSGKSISGKFRWHEDIVKKDDAPFCIPEVLFEDVDLYRWRYDPNDCKVAERPFDSPDSSFLKRWKYWRWRFQRLWKSV